MVSRLKQIVEEVLGKVQPYPSVGYKGIRWDKDSDVLIIEYLEKGITSIRVYRYHYFARIYGTHAWLSSTTGNTQVFIENTHSGLRMNDVFPQVLDIFTSESAITDFLYGIRDMGIEAFKHIVIDYLNTHSLY